MTPPQARDPHPPAEPPRHSALLNVQALRALAAVMVIFVHLGPLAARAGLPAVDLEFGNAGVDIFFVISGFIMWVIAARRPPSPGVFLARRAGRIVPLYWLVTLALAAAYVAAPGLFPNLKPTPAHVLQSLAFIPHRDPAGVAAPLVIPGWTLNFEVFFYLVFALALFLPERRRLWALTGGLCLLAALGAVFRPSSVVLSTYTSPLLLEFLAGAWIGKTWSDGYAPPPVQAWGLVGAGAGMFALVTWSGVDTEPWRLLLWGAPAAMIVAGAVGLERAGQTPEWKPAKFLGDSSYSLYLAHGLAISLAAKVCERLGLGSGPVLFLVAVATGLAAGSACYVLIERPLLRLFHRRSRPRLTKVPVPAAG